MINEVLVQYHRGGMAMTRWRIRAWTFLTLTMVIGGLTATPVLQSGQAAARTGRAGNPAPLAVSSFAGLLEGVSATSSTNAWAVGSYYPTAISQPRTLILHWNGTSWSKVASPNPSSTGSNWLYGVSATSASNAWAVGSSNGRTVILRWNGTAWSKAASPNPSSTGNWLFAVRATSAANAWAVGSYRTANGSRTLILRWNGSAWSKVASPNPSPTGDSLSAVSATSGTNAWAVGYSGRTDAGRTLILRWNGTAWSKIASPNPSSTSDSLSAVSATSGTNAWAVGDRNSTTNGWPRTLILRWNGTSWSTVASPNFSPTLNLLYGVSATSSRNAWAAGYYCNSPSGVPCHTLILRWNGASWSKVASPNPGSEDNYLHGMTATSGTNAWAVGYYTSSTPGGATTLILHWNGTSWTRS